MKLHVTSSEGDKLAQLPTDQVFVGFLNFNGPCDFTFIGPYEGLLGEIEYEDSETPEVLHHGRLYWGNFWTSKWPSSSPSKITLRHLGGNSYKIVHLYAFRDRIGGWSSNDFMNLIEREELLPLGR
ncbi:MAG: hypothetical protein JWQ08_1964 [Deinococcus sp.]|nr:hypothetical protein [Deinococcus sp.]